MWSLYVTNLTLNFSCIFISILYTFRTTMCLSSAELLYQCDTWFMLLCVDDRLLCIPDGHLTHSDINQVSEWYNIAPDDGHMAAWNMLRIEINVHKHTRSDINQVSHWYNNSADDGHTAAWNMLRIEINIHEKLCVKLGTYKDHTRMHGQQNIKHVNLLSQFRSLLRMRGSKGDIKLRFSVYDAVYPGRYTPTFRRTSNRHFHCKNNKPRHSKMRG